MAEYARKQMNIYIADNDLKQQILDIYRNPTNIDSRKILDGNIRAIFSDKGEKLCLSRDKALRTFKTK